jgi:flavin-dependent dehydrogenase
MYDVAVLGGGPAGLAAAIALARLNRSVVVLERTSYERARAGETFGGDVKPLLRALGVADVEEIGAVPFRGILSAWGRSEAVERASIFNPFGEGWHVDRKLFDRRLAACAEGAAVIVRLGTGACTASMSADGWRVQPASGDEVAARLVIDASGRGASGTTGRVQRRWLQVDRLVAVLGTVARSGIDVEPVLLLEAVEDGWWYSVPQPGGGLLVALMTDADLIPASARTNLAAYLTDRMRHAEHTVERVGGRHLAATSWIARADSGVLLPDSGPTWRAVGDAAMACDPLAGDGVVRAIRSGMATAVDADAQMAGRVSTAVAAAPLEQFAEYLETRGRYYAYEQRWPNALFWTRRRPIDWQHAPLFLEPLSMLRPGRTTPDRHTLAPVETLIPPIAQRGLFARLRQTPERAHESMRFLQSVAPLGDQRLLVGLQYLVASGVIAADA